MRVFIDSNILYSAIFAPSGTVNRAYFKAITPPNVGLISEQNIAELHKAFLRKSPDKLDALKRFWTKASLILKVVPIPEESTAAEFLIRDSADRLIYRAALHADADVLLTGDKDLLESGITRPLIVSPAAFLELD